MHTSSHVELPDPQLLTRFDRPGPRYTSYPTADRFVEAFDASAYSAQLTQRGDNPVAPPLSLYVHVPFCNTVCYYCACNKVITRRHELAVDYLDVLEREMDLVGATLTGPRTVEQLHLGGGTPTYLTDAELERLMQMLAQRFDLAANGERSIEIDPRSAPPEKVRTLAQLGFNRLSVGVQDFDGQVQRAVNRIQPFEMTQTCVETARMCGIGSINLDLIYGLPRQTRKTFAATLDKVLVLGPDRVALYHYAHLPERFKPQRRIDTGALPSPAEKMQIMRDAVERLVAAGYEYIGMDHFAKRSDELARAQALGRLHRNFQGYSTRPDCDLVGLGVSAISKVGTSYAQNQRELPGYADQVRAGQLPTARGALLDADDLARRAVIMSLMCRFALSKEAIEAAYLLRFDEYFRRELAELHSFEEAGLLQLGREWITVLPRGKLLIRAIAMVFDRYLSTDVRLRRYSKIV